MRRCSQLRDVVCKHITPEGQALGLLDHLLVHAGVLRPHDDVVLRRVDLGIETRVADEVHDPLLGGHLVHVELLSQHANVDDLVDAAVGLKDEEACVLDKLVSAGDEEEVVRQNSLALAQLLLCALKVKVDVEALDELGDRIAVEVVLLLNNLRTQFGMSIARLDSTKRKVQSVKSHGSHSLTISYLQFARAPIEEEGNSL